MDILTNIPNQLCSRPILILDSCRCKYSCELNKEVRKSLHSNSCEIVDLSTMSVQEVKSLQWLPGVPCLIVGETLYLGVAAFTQVRDIIRKDMIKTR